MDYGTAGQGCVGGPWHRRARVRGDRGPDGQGSVGAVVPTGKGSVGAVVLAGRGAPALVVWTLTLLKTSSKRFCLDWGLEATNSASRSMSTTTWPCASHVLPGLSLLMHSLTSSGVMRLGRSTGHSAPNLYQIQEPKRFTSGVYRVWSTLYESLFRAHKSPPT